MKASLTWISHHALLAGFCGALWVQAPLYGQSTNKAMPRLKVDEAALPQEIRERTSYANVAKKISPSVVNVYSTRKVKERGQLPMLNDPLFRRFFGGGEDEDAPRSPGRQEGLGSGVIVSEDGYIVTNTHVVEDASGVRVALASGQEYPATVVGTDPATDVAIVKIEATGLPAITQTDSSKIEVGDTVLAVGNPFGVGQTVTVGIVSATGRGGFGIVDYEDFIQTDASINPGNSGGALTDVTGRLIGINTAIISRTGGNQGIGFAVPVNMVRYALQQIIEHGRVVRGYLGIYIQPLNPELARAFDIPEAQHGALVASVSPKSPAEKAGLKEGDVITRFNGKDVTDSRQLRLMVAQTPPKASATMTVLRSGKEQQVTTQLAELQPENLVARGRGLPEAQPGRTSFLEGLEVMELDTQARRQFNVPPSVQGLVVAEVQPDSPAEQAGLRPGDVITDVNRHPVKSLDEARALSKDNKGDPVLLRVWSSGGQHYVVVNQGETRSSGPREKESRRPNE